MSILLWVLGALALLVFLLFRARAAWRRFVRASQGTLCLGSWASISSPATS